MHENPDAAARLPLAFGQGAFDERYGATENSFGRIFVGRDLEQLELAERELNLRRSLL